MNDKTGGPAFPRTSRIEGSRDMDSQQGMTLRDYFAAQVLTGLIANDDALQRVINSAQGRQPIHAPDNFKLAAFCYTIADAMLAECAK